MNKKIKYMCYIIFLFLIICLIYINKSAILQLVDNLYYSFNRTLIEEDRYILILRGLQSTLIISTFSIIFGTILGFILYFLRVNKIKILRTVSKLMIEFLQGTPVTVLLLIFYYVIFGSFNINSICVAIMTFSIYFSAYTTEIFRGAYASLNKSQICSAHSLGFTKIQTIRYIILPQVLSYIIPVFKNESVSLIKSTSIAGYISVMELTKASDIIRNRTYEPFFPLIFTAIIYYLICLIIGKMLDYVHKKINPRMEKKYGK